jgi:glutathione synthase/RimK-type ligase-like ATP-grasp enzyme
MNFDHRRTEDPAAAEARIAETFEPPRPVESPAPKLLIVATLHWVVTTRLCMALGDAGFQVTALAPPGHGLHALGLGPTRRLGRSRPAALNSIVRAIEAFDPEIVIPSDEGAIDLLRTLHARAIGGNAPLLREMAGLIERSLGSPSAFIFAGQKDRFVALAREEGLLVPRTEVIGDIGDLRRKLRGCLFPVVLKQNESYGGKGVRIATSASDAERLYLELQTSARVKAALKKSIRKLDLAYLFQLYRKPAIALQEYISGRPANRAVVCERGKVLAGLTVEVLQSCWEAGPATVVRSIHSAEIDHASTRLVGRLGLSGFFGFDFILQHATGRAYLLEMNGRPTQTCHMAISPESDMVSALARFHCLTPSPRARPDLDGVPIALFPQEVWRDPASPYLNSAYVDCPASSPAFVAAYRNPILEETSDLLEMIRRKWRALRTRGGSNRSYGNAGKASPSDPVLPI